METERAAPQSSRERRFRGRRRVLRPTFGKFAAAAFLPLCGLIWFLAMGPEARERLLDRLPPGAATRALHAGISLAVVSALCWFVLPLVHGAELGMRRTVHWFRTREGAARVLLLPFEGAALVFRWLASGLFVANALSIVAAGLATLLFGAWIAFPGFLGGIREWILGFFPAG